MSVCIPLLSVENNDEISKSMDMEEEKHKNEELFCHCKSDYCDCGSPLGVTELSALKVFEHLGFKNGYSDLISQDYRPSVLNLWGTHNLSTEDIMSWLSEYGPQTIEWINDASCNVQFPNANTVFRVIVNFTEPFNHRVALAAAAVLASLIRNDQTNKQFATTNTTNPISDRVEEMMDVMEDNESQLDSSDSKLNLNKKALTVSNEDLHSIEQFSQHLPPTGRWFKALSVPSKAVSLFLRFAHKTDVKMRGAERHSLYYRRYGNPNYGGMTGMLSRSYRQRIRTSRNNNTGGAPSKSFDVRHVDLVPSNFAELVANAYDNFDSFSINSPCTVNDGVFRDVDESGDNYHEYKIKNKTHSSFKNLGIPTIWNSISKESISSISSTGPTQMKRNLVVYDNLYDDDDDKIKVNHKMNDVNVRNSKKNASSKHNFKVGQRRNANEFPIPKSAQFSPKWSRRELMFNRWRSDEEFSNVKHHSSTTPSLNVSDDDIDAAAVDDLDDDDNDRLFTTPEAGINVVRLDRIVKTAAHTGRSGGGSHGLVRRPTIITLMPDSDSQNDGDSIKSKRMLAKNSMMADIEYNSKRNRPISDRLGACPSNSFKKPASIWKRLG